jgi:hypothetical protein
MAWCQTDLVEIITAKLREEPYVSPEDFIVLASGLQAYYCDAAMNALDPKTAFFRGEGDFVITRHGNNGAVHKIMLDIDMH